MSEERKKREIRNFKILIIIVALFTALFPLYQCVQTIKMKGNNRADVPIQNQQTKGQPNTKSH